MKDAKTMYDEDIEANVLKLKEKKEEEEEKRMDEEKLDKLRADQNKMLITDFDSEYKQMINVNFKSL